MNKEFVPYEPSLRLKALGFDEPCFATWSGETLDMSLQVPSDDYFTKAPTFSQAFRFFREKYEIYYTIEGSKKFGFQHFIYDEKGSYEIKSEEIFKNYEEAELACLIRLIEIVEKEQENDK
jgi:hypothetical protein